MLLRSLVTVQKRVPSHLHSSFWMVAHRRLWVSVVQRRCFSAISPPADRMADQISKPREDDSQRNVFARLLQDMDVSTQRRDWDTFGSCFASLGKLLRNQNNPWIIEKVRSDLIPMFQKWKSRDRTSGKDVNCVALLSKLIELRFSASRKEEKELIEEFIDSFLQSEKTGFSPLRLFLLHLKTLDYNWEMFHTEKRHQFFGSVQFYLQKRGDRQRLTDQEFLDFTEILAGLGMELGHRPSQFHTLFLDRLDCVDSSVDINHLKIAEFIRSCGAINLDVYRDTVKSKNRKEMFVNWSHTILKTLEFRKEMKDVDLVRQCSISFRYMFCIHRLLFSLFFSFSVSSPYC
jgi:hypothetical protein